MLKEIKKELLKLNTVHNVHYNTRNKTITIIPKQDLSFFSYDDVLNDYVICQGLYEIKGQWFKKVWGENFNTQIYSMKIKLANKM